MNAACLRPHIYHQMLNLSRFAAAAAVAYELEAPKIAASKSQKGERLRDFAARLHGRQSANAAGARGREARRADERSTASMRA